MATFKTFTLIQISHQSKHNLPTRQGKVSCM